jgi:hypothetical protein
LVQREKYVFKLLQSFWLGTDTIDGEEQRLVFHKATYFLQTEVKKQLKVHMVFNHPHCTKITKAYVLTLLSQEGGWKNTKLRIFLSTSPSWTEGSAPKC